MSDATSERGGALRAGLLGLGLALALATGVALRLAYPLDIEWKGDEKWTFAHAQALAAGGPWPWLGMMSSVGVPNPGLSLWVFAGLDAVFDPKTPPELARAVQTLNGAALLAFVLFAFAAIPRERREPWLWAAALWAVNPLAIIFERKIWPPSVLPLASVALIAAWQFRSRAAAAFAWGFLGALMAQVHMGVAFFTGALAAWTWVYERNAFRWNFWLAGGFIGALPALPWLIQAASHGGGAGGRLRFPTFSFFFRWLTQPFGFGVNYALGHAQMMDYLASPLWADRPTYLMAIAHLILACLLLVILARAIRAARVLGWPGARAFFFAFFIGADPERLLINATLWGYGGCLELLTLFGPTSNRHYLIVVAPIMALWAARAVMYGDLNSSPRRARALLVALCLSQAIVSAGLLSYIHRTPIISGEYGATWRSQQPGFVAPTP